MLPFVFSHSKSEDGAGETVSARETLFVLQVLLDKQNNPVFDVHSLEVPHWQSLVFTLRPFVLLQRGNLWQVLVEQKNPVDLVHSIVPH